jgi:hypothetical protein
MLWRVLSLVLVLALAAPWVVWADNVNNDVTVGGSDTFTLGDSTTVGYKVVANSGDDQPGCNASDGSTATVTIITPAGVTANPGSLEFDACNIFKDVVFTASAAGNYEITVSVADSGVGGYHTTPATFTLKVLPAAPEEDTTPPVIAWVGDIEDGDAFYYGFVPEEPTCTAVDDVDGVVECVVDGYGTTVGSHTLTATASDAAGNKAEETRSYTVLAWTLNGFYRPVNMDAINTVKGGSTVPLKFEVFAGETELTDPAVVSFAAKKVPCAGETSDEDPVDFVTTGGTSLRYDPIEGQFVQNWQTPKAPGTCYVVTMTTQDGSTLAANFKLK